MTELYPGWVSHQAWLMFVLVTAGNGSRHEGRVTGSPSRCAQQQALTESRAGCVWARTVTRPG